jgi:hypothetical protein
MSFDVFAVLIESFSFVLQISDLSHHCNDGDWRTA